MLVKKRSGRKGAGRREGVERRGDERGEGIKLQLIGEARSMTRSVKRGLSCADRLRQLPPLKHLLGHWATLENPRGVRNRLYRGRGRFVVIATTDQPTRKVIISFTTCADIVCVVFFVCFFLFLLRVSI